MSILSIFLMITLFAGNFFSLDAMLYKEGTRAPIIILFDQNQIETPVVKSIQFVTDNFAQAIRQQAAAILVNQSVLYNLVYRKEHHDDPEHPENAKLKYVHFYNNRWFCYQVPNTQFYLFVLEGKFSLYREHLNLDQLIQIQLPLSDSSHQEFIDQTDPANHPQPKFSIGDFDKIFKYEGPLFDDPIIWDIFLNGHGDKDVSIAGFSIKEIQTILKFFALRINTGIVMISSCYAGGTNMQYLTFDKTIDTPSFFPLVNYPIIVVNVDDSIAYASNINFSKIFSHTRQLSTGSGRNLTDLMNELGKFVGSKGSLHKSANIPQIILPGGRLIQSLTPDDKILVIGNTFAKKHELNSQDIIISNTKDSILIYPVRIKGTLRYNGPTESNLANLEAKEYQWKLLPTFFELMARSYDAVYAGVDMSSSSYPTLEKKRNQLKLDQAYYQTKMTLIFPNIISMLHGDATHRFSKIIINPFVTNTQGCGVWSFIRDAFHDLNGRATQKVFLIDQLIGDNDLLPLLEAQRTLEKKTQQDSLEKLILNLDTLTLEKVIVTTRGNFRTINDQDEFTIKTEIIFKVGGRSWRGSIDTEHEKANIIKLYPFSGSQHNQQWNKELSNIKDDTVEGQKSIPEVIKAQAQRILQPKEAKKD